MNKSALVFIIGIATSFAIVTQSGCVSSSAPGSVDAGGDATDALQDTASEIETEVLDDVVDGDQSDKDMMTSCKIGETACIEGKLAVCDGKYGWLLENCPQGLTCVDGECVESECEPLEARCTEGGVQVCSPAGTGWSLPMPCKEDQKCKGGMCVPLECEPDSRVCSDNMVIVCAPTGDDVVIVECADGQVCFNGECIECLKDADCGEGLSCVEGKCGAPALEIVTEAISDGQVGEPYSQVIEAKGGVPPYTWSFSNVNIAAGLAMDAAAASLAGTPSAQGEFSITVKVTDSDGTEVSRDYSFTIYPAEIGIVITTGSPLPGGEEGTAYSVNFEATGGVPPYTWGIVGGEIPAGLELNSSGKLAGIPEAHGTFTFMVKVFDNADNIHSASKEFSVSLKIAPLEIVGAQQYDLWVAKIIILPLLTSIQGLPLPYNAQLEAKGGVKPYHWSEDPLPFYVSFLIPDGGIPEGLTLSETGKLSGSVTDPSLAASIKVPGTQIELSGFFFVGKVEDSQSPADSATAIYLIPTVPVAF